VLQECPRVSQECYKGVTGVFQECYLFGVSLGHLLFDCRKQILWCFKGELRVFRIFSVRLGHFEGYIWHVFSVSFGHFLFDSR
jgi:hypothetical protein